MGGVGGTAVAVDAADLDEGQQRLGRAADDLAVAGEGLAGLGGDSGLAVGADALLDALGDLSRTWLSRLERLEVEAGSLRQAVRAAADGYRDGEHGVLSMLLDTGIDTPVDAGPRAGTRAGTGGEGGAP